jgi:F0F1-type ATP synthase assembly protein I
MEAPNGSWSASLPPDEEPKRGWRVGGGTDYVRDPLQMGLTIVGVTAAFGGIGWWLDSLLGTFPFLMALGAVAGMFGILYVTVLKLRDSDKQNRPPDSRS